MSLGFFVDGRLKKVSTTSGVVTDLAEAGSLYGLAGAWGPGDRIVYPGSMGLSEIASAGGTSRPLLPPEERSLGKVRALFPDFLPGSDALLVSSTTGDSAEDLSIDLLTISTGKRRVLVQRGSVPRYLPTGHLVFLRDGAVMAVRFDVHAMEPVGTPVEVLGGLRQVSFGAFSCSREGSCVYIAGGAPTQRRVTLVDRTGAARPLPLTPNSYLTPRFSPSGDKLSFWIGGRRCDVAVYDIAGGTTTKLTSENDNHYPIWRADGQRLAYLSKKPDAPGYELVSRSVSGARLEEPVAASGHYVAPLTSLSWSRLGAIVFADRGDLWALSGSANSQPRPFAPSRFNETEPAFSPDGRWLAYASDETGRFEVYVRPFPGSGEKIPVSIAGGSEPAWDPRGRELFFRNGDQMMVVPVKTQPTFSAGRPRLLFTGPFVRQAGLISYDVSPDGESFVMLDSGEESGAATQVNVLINWFEELKRLVPAP
jgi:serine/threonine-protein kinase